MTILTSLIADQLIADQGLDVVIPDIYTVIGDRAFYDSQLNSIVIPDGVTSIGDAAFKSNQLTTVVIPDSVTSIGGEVFLTNPLEGINISADAPFPVSVFPAGVNIIIRGLSRIRRRDAFANDSIDTAFYLYPPLSYSKRFAQRLRGFNVKSDVASINLDDFSTTLTGIYFAKSKKSFKKAQVSDSAFIYYRKKGRLYFNENGSSKKYGDGGLIAVFNKKTRLDDKNFIFSGGLVSAPSTSETPTPEPTPAPVPTPTPEPTPAPVPTPTPEPTPPPVPTSTPEPTPAPVPTPTPEPTPAPVPTPTPEPTPAPVPTSTPEPTPAPVSLRDGDAASGEIAVRNEKDLFLLDVPSGHEVTLSATGDTYPVLNIVNSAGEVLKRGSWNTSLIYVRGTDPIYVQVYGYGGNTGSYDVELNSKLYLTPKQQRESAPLLDENGNYNGSISSEGEIDYFKISEDVGDIISISLTSEDDLYPQLAIVDTDGKEIPSVSRPSGYGSNNYDIKLFEFPPSAEPIYLEVRTQNDNYIGDYDIIFGSSTRAGFKNEVIRLTNYEREQRGLQPLLYDPILEAAAQAHVNDMDSSGRYLAHTGSNGSSPGDRIELAGYQAQWHVYADGSKMYPSQENAAYGQRSPEEVVNGWMNSPGHRAAILTPETKEIGVGFEIDDVTGGSYWIQNFGIPLSTGGDQYYF